jgi:hypothetical protein
VYIYISGAFPGNRDYTHPSLVRCVLNIPSVSYTYWKRRRAAEDAGRAQLLLGKVRDPFHERLRAWMGCLESQVGVGDNPAVMQPQGCRVGWVMLALRYDTISWVLLLLVSLCAHQAIFCYEYSQTVQIVLTIALARLLRLR